MKNTDQAHKSESKGKPGNGPLSGLQVLDLSRILAGPTATQLLGDLGAEVYKIERPGRGDDTRAWGPPFLQDPKGQDTTESAYYLSSNRNKQSVAINIASGEGQALIRQLATRCDVLIENFKVGDLARRGLDYEALSEVNPRLIYCSITGFGQTGPYSQRAGYDFLIQGMGGIMSITGMRDEDGGRPTKVGVGIADVMCGMYATVAILAALHHRQESGRGQHIDLALLDSQVAWLINQGAAFLTSGTVPGRLGNAHPTIVPYETFPGSDGEFIIATGNDDQYSRMCKTLGAENLIDDPRFVSNADRVRNRDELIPLIGDITKKRPAADWIAELERVGVPCGPVNDLGAVFSDPQIVHREMKINLPHKASGSGTVDLIGNPIQFSETPVTYRNAPPQVGDHTRSVLGNVLGIDQAELDEMERSGIIQQGGANGDRS